jgi:hypothetical protein
MLHQQFDIQRWKNLFSLEKLRKQAREFVEARRRELPDQYKTRATSGKRPRWSILLKRSKSPRDFFSGLGARRALEKAYHRSWHVASIEGTKIGGVPSWIQPAQELPGRFLCTLSSVHPVYQTSADDIVHRPYPFTNFEGPFVRGRRVFRTAEEEIQTDRLLMWDDVGSLFLFLDHDGHIHWTTQSY